MSHLQSIERACQKAIPSILTHEIEHYQGPDSPPEIEPVYRPITLQDILLCLGDNIMIDGGGYFLRNEGMYEELEWFAKAQLDKNNEMIRYDLTKSPYDQSEEVLQFLAENLTK